MLEDVYFRFGKKPAVWWPILLTQSSYICVQSNSLSLPDQFSSENPPKLTDVMRACQVNPHELWLSEGSSDLAWAEKVRQASNNPWINLGSGTTYFSGVEQLLATTEYGLLAELPATKLHFEKKGVLRFNFGLKTVTGIVRGPLETIWG